MPTATNTNGIRTAGLLAAVLAVGLPLGWLVGDAVGAAFGVTEASALLGLLFAAVLAEMGSVGLLYRRISRGIAAEA